MIAHQEQEKEQAMAAHGTNDGLLDVAVVGGSQAGLAIAWHLARQRLRFAVLDAAPQIGHTWRSRWDSLTLFTPAQYNSLPGMAFPAPPGTYPGKDPVAAYLQAYAAAFNLPVRLNARVTDLARTQEGFEARTADGQVLRARQVVVATGPFQVPCVPPAAQRLDGSATQLHSVEYRNPQALPEGPVLVVGGGNSGFQIAEELAAAGRRVHLSIATKQPALPQRLAGRDLFWWLTRLRLMRVTTESRLGRRMSRRDFIIGSSRRRLQKKGVRFRPRLTGADGRAVHFADGSTLDAAVVIWATGYRPDYSWIHVPGVAQDGEPAHRRGVTDVPGLYFLGLTWQHTRGSALLGFGNDDAAYLAGRIAAHQRATSAAMAGAAPRPPGRTEPYGEQRMSIPEPPRPAAARADKLTRKPGSLSFEQAAAVAVSGLAALQGLRAGHIQAGQKVLVIGASGGVGSYAVQMAKAFGAKVTGVCSTGKTDLVRSIGFLG